MWIVLILLMVAAILAYRGLSISAPKYKGPISDHFNGKEFFTPGAPPQHGFSAVLKWMFTRKRGPWRELPASPDARRPIDSEREHIRITFINHATFLIQVDGMNILTDPVWSSRVSPFTWGGPKRMRPPGVKMEDLPKIHYILLSHNHYDHLDIATLRTLFGAHHPKFITPLGVKAYLDEERIAGALDLDWWQQHSLSDKVTATCVPAKHFSGRGTRDRNATLWCGYVLSTSKGNIYFAGDTGYDESIFKAIGERFSTMRVSMIPIGAYKPSWFMSPVHVSPEEALIIHQEVKSQLSIGMHFGTFSLADEGQDEPPQDLRTALDKRNISVDQFIALEEGVARVIE